MLAAAAAIFLSSPAAAKWREAKTDHFVIYSEESTGDLRAFAERLERFDSAMRYIRQVPAAELGAASRVTVYVVGGVNSVQRLAGDKSGMVAGFYIPRAAGSVAVVPRRAGSGQQWDMNAETVFFHEYGHHFFYQNFAGAFPSWFSEGFAEFHSTARFDPDGSVGLGLPALHRAYGLGAFNGLSVDNMVSMTGETRLRPEQTELLYGKGWLLTHYLTFEEKRAGQLGNYLKLINQGQPSREAALTAFGDLKKLDGELEDYMRRRRLSFVRIAPGAIRTGPIAIRDLRAGEEAVMQLRIRSDRGVDEKQAKEVMTEMRRRAAPYPGDPAVQAQLAEAEYDAGNYAEADAAADRAISAEATHLDALIYKAMARMKLAEDSNDATKWREVRRLIGAANRVDPDHPEPLILFYTSYMRQGIAPTRNAVDGLNRAFELAPQDNSLRMAAAYQYLQDDKADDARAALAPIAFHPHGGETRKFAASVIAAIDGGGSKKGLEAWEADKPSEGDATSAPSDKPSA
jgi:tetratricopeptide (TPR) repeat protein